MIVYPGIPPIPPHFGADPEENKRLLDAYNQEAERYLLNVYRWHAPVFYLAIATPIIGVVGFLVIYFSVLRAFVPQ